MISLVLAAVLYVMYARGAFEAQQNYVLIAEDAEGISVGMDITFSGFPIGRVSKIELSSEGNAHINISVPRKDTKWLRTSSIFTLERGLVGGAKLRAFSGILTDPPLEEGAERKLLVGDASSEIPRLVATAKELIENLKALTAADSSLDASLGNVKTLTEKMNAKQGVLGAVMGDPQNVQKLLTTLDRTNALLVRVDSLTANADKQIFGSDGVMKDAQQTVRELNQLLAETRTSLKKVDAVLIEAQAVGANVKAGTADLGALRNDVEASLRKVDAMIIDLNRRWPFKKDAEIKLP
jgi:phospholipid/cholesterol/gamma-HCH transport system substrate-binding protein